MTIAVVIPTIPERADLLQRAIASVTAQTLQPDEICIAVARDDEPAWSTRDRALAMATTQWVAMLDDDDEFEPHHLQACTAWQQRTDADLVYPWFTVIGGQDPFGPHFDHVWDPDEPYQTTITVLARREAVLAVGGYQFDDDGQDDGHGNRAGEDFDMVRRLNAAGYKISHLPERTWLWHHHHGNTSGLPHNRPSRRLGV